VLALNPCPRSIQVGEFEVVIRENTSRKKKNFITNQFNHFLMHVFAKYNQSHFFQHCFRNLSSRWVFNCFLVWYDGQRVGQLLLLFFLAMLIMRWPSLLVSLPGLVADAPLLRVVLPPVAVCS
jgi:hypothetical protein